MLLLVWFVATTKIPAPIRNLIVETCSRYQVFLFMVLGWFYIIGLFFRAIHGPGLLSLTLKLILSPLLIFIHLFFSFVLGVIGLAIVGSQSFYYAIHAYMLRTISPSESCFFMPCAPQSIIELNQVGALLLGLVLFASGEVILPLYHCYQMRRRGTSLKSINLQD